MLKKTNLKIFCSLEKKITQVCLQDNTFTSYLCGPTVYNDVHIGNLRPILFFDLIIKYFHHLKIKTIFVHNITDIDDKIVNRAKEENISETKISKKYYLAYLKILKNFFIKKPDYLPKVTSNINLIKIFINNLIEKNYCYTLNDDGIYFDISQFSNHYFLLSRNKEDNLIKKASSKKNPLDFSIWKFKTEGKIWNAKFGNGRPGWHTECVVLIRKYFSKLPISLHGGGVDLLFPHHENEIIQNFSLSKNFLAKNWIHFGLINFNNKKMSKSENNFWLAKDFLKKYDQKVLRFFYFEKNYRTPLNISLERLNEIKNIFSEWQQILNCLTFFNFYFQEKNEKIENIYFFDETIKFFENNLNVAKIIDNLILLNKKIKNFCSSNEHKKALGYYLDLRQTYKFLGFDFKIKKYFKNDIKLFLKWQFFVQQKKYLLADKTREILKKKDIILVF